MAQFTSFPSSRVRVADIQGAMRQAQQDVTANRLSQAKMGQVQAGLDMRRETLDLAKLEDLRKLNEADRERLKEQSGVYARLGRAILSSQSDVERANLYSILSQKMKADGAPPPPPFGSDELKAFLIGGIAEYGDWDKYQEELNKSRTKAPRVETFYTPKGGSQKNQWNPKTETWEPVGGVKAPSGMYIKSGEFEFRSGAGVGVGGLSKKDIETAAGNIPDTTFNIVSGASLLNDLDEIGRGATGVRGVIGEVAGGLAGQVSEDFGQTTTKAITGTTPERLSGMRNRARQYVAQRIPVMTGEESGRYTEAERALTTEALRILETTASLPQIRGAIETVMGIEVMSIERDKLKTQQIAPGLTNAQINKLGDRLSNDYKMSNEAVKRTLKDVKALHKAFKDIY